MECLRAALVTAGEMLLGLILALTFVSLMFASVYYGSEALAWALTWLGLIA